MGRKGFSKSFKEQIVHDYLDNDLKLKEIVKKYNIGYNSIWKWCIELGRRELIPFGNTYILKIKTACNFSYDNIINYAIDNNLKFVDIVEEFNLNEDESIKLNAIISALNRRNKFKIPTKIAKYSGHKDEIIADIKAGISREDLEKKYNFSHNGYIYIFLNSLESEYPELREYIGKIVRHINKPGRISKDDQYIIDHCKDMTIIDICNELGLKYQTVQSKAIRLNHKGYNIEFRRLRRKRNSKI